MATLFGEKYYGNADFSDVTVEWSGREIKAHRVVLCSHSEYFQAALSPNERFQEAQVGIIELHDDEPHAVEAMLRWMYSGKWKASKSWEATLAQALATDKYGVVGMDEQVALTLAHRIQGLKVGSPVYGVTGKDYGYRCALETTAMLRTVMEKTLEYPDRMGKVGDAVPYCLNAHTNSCRQVYAAPGCVRAWMDRYPDQAAKLVATAGQEIRERPEFVEHIRQNPELAVKLFSCLEQKCRGELYFD